MLRLRGVLSQGSAGYFFRGRAGAPLSNTPCADGWARTQSTGVHSGENRQGTGGFSAPLPVYLFAPKGRAYVAPHPPGISGGAGYSGDDGASLCQYSKKGCLSFEARGPSADGLCALLRGGRRALRRHSSQKSRAGADRATFLLPLFERKISDF